MRVMGVSNYHGKPPLSQEKSPVLVSWFSAHGHVPRLLVEGVGCGMDPQNWVMRSGEDGAMDARGMGSSWISHELLQEIDPGPTKEGN